MICQPLSNSDAICRRAGGRRRYNKVRQFMAFQRLLQVVALLKELGLGRGSQSRIAEHLGVHRSTICRDVAKLERGFWGGREAEERQRAEVRMQRRIRAEDQTEQESSVADDAVAPECEVERPSPSRKPINSPAPVRDEQALHQPPRRLQASRSHLANRLRPNGTRYRVGIDR